MPDTATEPHTETTPPAPSEPAEPTRSTRMRRAIETTAAGMVGAGVLAGILFAAGAVGGGPTTVEPVSTGPAVGAGALHPAALYAAAAPGVVDITAHTTGTVRNQSNPFNPSQSQSADLGSGVVVDGDGRILTADHVVRGASSVSVTFANGTTRTARILGQDPTSDLAVIAVSPSGLTLHPLALGDSASMQVGDPVAALGDPFGYPRSMSIGIVSGLDRTIQGLDGFSVAHAIQTDAAIDPGNSGGPLLNARGQVVGIVDQIATGTSGAQSSTGVGFAVSSNVASAELTSLEHGTAVQHAFLGIATAPAIGADGTNGVLVGGVQSAGPAAKAGVHTGDVILAIDGKPLRGVNDLISILAGDRPGQHVTLRVQRDGHTTTLHAVLAQQPASSAAGS